MKARDKLGIGSKILQARLSNRARPFFVQYSLINACDGDCVYCNCPNRENPQLTTEEHLRIFDEFARLGTVRVKFLGGEPLLRDDLGELIEGVKSRGMRCAMTTNGYLIPKRFDWVRNLDEIIISIDGDERAHDALRGAGTWRKVMQGIEMCAAEGLDFFLTTVLTRSNLDQVDWMLALARRLGVMANFQMVQHNPEMYGPEASRMVPEREETQGVLRKIIRAKQEGAPVLFTERSYRRTLEWADYHRERVERPGERSPCTAGRYFVEVEPNGDVYPCVLHMGGFQPKNALRDGVEEAWRHAGEHSCFDCYNTWLNENRAIFDLAPSVLVNFWNNYMRRRPRALEAAGQPGG